MSESTEKLSPKPRKPLWRRIAKWTLRIVVVLIVIGLLAWAGLYYYSVNRLADEINKIKAAGQPINFKDLAKTYKEVPPADDARPYYAAAADLTRGYYVDIHIQEAFKKATLWPGYSDQTATVEKPLTLEEAMVKARESLATPQVRSALEMQDLGAQQSGCNPYFYPKFGIWSLMSQLFPMRNLARINAYMRTELLALQGRGDEACRSAISGLKTNRVFDCPYCLNVYMVQLPNLLLNDRTPEIISYGHASAEALREYRKALAEAGDSLNPRSSWIGERVYVLEMARSAFPGQRELQVDDPNDPPIPISSGAGTGVYDNSTMRLLIAQEIELFNKIISISDHPFPTRLTEMKAIEELSRNNGLGGEFGQISMPGWSRMIELEAQGLAQIRGSLVALDAELYRQANGRLPADLKELAAWTGQALPTDPFTGKDMIYKVENGGFVVYSLGPDLKEYPTVQLNWGILCNYGVRIRYSQPIKLPPATMPATATSVPSV